MPQEQVTVYSVETGAPLSMHSVDAAEAILMGSYVARAPDGPALVVAPSPRVEDAPGIEAVPNIEDAPIIEAPRRGRPPSHG